MIAWKKDLFRDFVRFGLIGGMGTVVNLSVFVSCMKAVAWLGYSPSKSLVDNVVLDYSLRIEHLFIAVAFVVANVFNFTMNSRFNFTARERVNRGGLAKFMIIGFVACVVQIVIFAELTRPGPIQLDPAIFDDSSGIRNIKYWGQAISILLVMPINFIFNRIWTFGHLGKGPERLYTASNYPPTH